MNENMPLRPRPRWRIWLPPILFALAALIALLLLGSDEPGAMFRYRLF